MRDESSGKKRWLMLAVLTSLWACSEPTPGAVGPVGEKGAPGARGADGAMGSVGAPGVDGQSATVTPEPVSANCINGGIKVQVGAAAASYVCQSAPQKYVVFVRGHFKSAATATNKMLHDQIVTQVRSTVTANGDERHLALLGLQDPRDFLAIDVWNNLAGLQGFLSDPQVQAGFGSLFDAPPSITVMVAPAGYTTWGTLGPKPNTFVLSVRATMSGSAAGSQAGHNQIAGGGQAVANSLGDYVHLVFLKGDAINSFQAIDHWDTVAGMNTFLSDPNVQAGFGSLFTAPPTIDIYTTSDFAQY